MFRLGHRDFTFPLTCLNAIPWHDDIAGPEERAEGEPQRVGEREVVDVLLDGGRCELVHGPPAGARPPVHREEDERHGKEDGAHRCPHLGGERRHERQEARLLLHRLLDHDTDAELHERCAEVDDALAGRRDRDGTERYVRLLRRNSATIAAGQETGHETSVIITSAFNSSLSHPAVRYHAYV